VLQRNLFESNLVSLVEFRQRRETTRSNHETYRPVGFGRRRASARSIAHQARMLAHLEKLTHSGRR
jgi:hypothetical protein